MRGLIVAAGLVMAGCYGPQPATGLPCAANGACPNGLECRAGRCEKPGEITDSSIDVPVDVAIDACANATCSGNDIVGCGPAFTCPTACSSIGGAHCMVLVPSNGLTGTMLQGATADVSGSWNFYDDGEIRKGNITLRVSGTGIIGGIGFHTVNGMSVYTARSFTVANGDSFDGSPSGEPLVLFAAKTINVAGQIDVGSSSDVGGPGGSSGNTSTTIGGCRGRAGRNLAATYAEGGGGGGGATSGANGGASNAAGPTGAGGSCATSPSTIPLRGGNGGGAGGASTLSAGGGGGGGLQLVAMESITISGVVASPGGGGISGTNGGGGGGGGGAILLESPTVMITSTGAVTANGGSGGAPSVGDGLGGSKTSATAVLGGAYVCPIVGGTFRGGSGGTRTASPTAGQTCTYDDLLGTNGSRGAGGGGAVGKIEMKALMSMTTGATLSPTPSQTTPMLE